MSRLGLLLGCLFVWLLAPPLFAVSSKQPLSQYLHTSWTQEEGTALPPIRALAQGADGYLWLGSTKGLMRFDGMRFTDWSPASGPDLPSLNVGWLRPASAGGLWVGTTAGLSRVDRGRVIRYPAAEKLPCALTVAMAEDRAGGLWLLNRCPSASTLAHMSQDGTVRTFGTGDGLPDPRVRTIYQDRQGNMWIATTTAICRWSPDSPAVCAKGPALQISAIAENAAGELMIADEKNRRVFRLSHGQLFPFGPHLPDGVLTGVAAYDRDGNFWIGTLGQGLLRVREDAIERYTRNDGLSNNLVADLVEDREGDIWIATARGVDRIRDPKIQVYSTQDGLSSDVINSVYGGQDGAVWIGTTGGLNRLAGGHVTVPTRADGLPNPAVLSLYGDAAGQMWVATASGLARQAGERFVEVLTTRGRHLQRVFGMAGDRSGVVWVSDSKQGLFRVQDGVAHPVTVPDAGQLDIVGLLVSQKGEVWLGHFGGGIDVLCGKTGRHYDSRDGLGGGPVRALYEDRDGSIWAGTGTGLSRFRDSRWATWSTAQGLPEGGVQSIAGDSSGRLWLLTPGGVLSIALSGLDSPAKVLQPFSFGRAEGLRLGMGMTNPRLTRSLDGRVWVCTEDGVAAIDPTRMKRNSVTPPLAIEQVIADGKSYNPAVTGEAAFRGHDLQIVYTGISLMAPERVRFRYRLLGLSRNWTDAGTRRIVDYVNLPPGHYTFAVTASNNDGVWNPAEAAFALRVDPYFYQTWWFALGCVLSTALLAWSAHRLRVRSVVSRLQLISAERVRFGRELHDSLLQGFSGVVFLLEAASRQFETAPELSKQRLDRAVDQADRSLREAREMIASLRIPALQDHNLAEALRATIAEQVAHSGVDAPFEIKGTTVQAPYNIEANLYMLAREAVTNALNHASPKSIRTELCYQPKQLRLTVQDDGTGFDPEAAMTKSGHYGFRGMRERARLIGADFTVDSATGRGSTIEVAVSWK